MAQQADRLSWSQLLEDGAIRATVACPQCGSSLAEHTLADTCDGCREPIGAALLSLYQTSSGNDPPVTYVRFDNQGIIVSQTKCLRCDADVTGRTITDRCRRCRAPLATLLDYPAFELIDGSWLRNRARDAYALAALVALLAAGLIIAVVSYLQTAFEVDQTADKGPLPGIIAVTTLLAFATATLFGLRATTQPAAFPEGAQRFTRVRRTRVALILATMLGAISAALSWSNPIPALQFGDTVLPPALWSRLCAAAAVMIGFFALAGLMNWFYTFSLLAQNTRWNGFGRGGSAMVALTGFVVMYVVIPWASFPVLESNPTRTFTVALPTPDPNKAGAILGDPAPNQPRFTHLRESDPGVRIYTSPNGGKQLTHANGLLTFVGEDSTATYDTKRTLYTFTNTAGDRETQYTITGSEDTAEYHTELAPYFIVPVSVFAVLALAWFVGLAIAAARLCSQTADTNLSR